VRLLVRPPILVVAVFGLIGAVAIGIVSTRPGSSNSALRATPGASTPASVAPTTAATARPAASSPPSTVPLASATPTPGPTLVPAPLTGRTVTPAQARQHVVAVMIDDQHDARPQSGFNAASVVWQAPAEGGIPRYMMLFQDEMPTSIGPVRSSRYYFIAWAAEWRSVYVHVGGSPQALQALRDFGNGQLVYNADEFRFGSRYLWRIATRSAPHNVYSDGEHLRLLSMATKAPDGPIAPAWRFGSDALPWQRPVGGKIVVSYLANTISYRYDRTANAYVRSVTGATPQIDAADHARVAPKNVIVMLMQFAPLGDGSTKGRLEAKVLGSGTAWIATNGHTIKGTWRKKTLTSPTQFFDAKGNPVTLTIGQTFIQVLPIGSPVSIHDGVTPRSITTPVPT
jgi:hypothetical protein